MKIFQKFSLVVLSTTFLLGGVGIISLRANQKIQETVEQGILEADKTRNSLRNIDFYFREIESETRSDLWLTNSDISLNHLQKKHKKINNLLLELKEEIITINQLTEKLLRFDSDSPQAKEEEEDDGGEALEEEVKLIRIANSLQEKQTKLEKIIESILNVASDDQQKILVLNKLERLLNDEIYPLL